MSRKRTRSETSTETKHFSGTEANTVESFYFPDREGIKCQNLKQTVGLNLKNCQIDHLDFKTRIFMDRLSGLLQDSRKEKLSLKEPCHKVIAVLSQFCTEVISLSL